MKPEDITVGHRFRKHLGNLDALAASIKGRGLLHPLVVTTDNQLVAGFRRLKAIEKLGWDDVPVRVIDPDDLVLAENDENEVREDFAPSERVAIAREIERRIGDRHGKRTDLNGELPVNGPEVEPGEETRDAAAKAAGFKSASEFRRAAAVVDNGTPELVEAMDTGDVSVSAAAEVANLPAAEQKKAVKAKKVKEKAKEQREHRNGKAPAKGKAKRNGKPAADETVAASAEETAVIDPADDFSSRVGVVCRSIDAAKAVVKELIAEKPYGGHIHEESVTYQLESARKALWQSRPTEPCNCVRNSTGANAKCKACFGTGRCPASRVLKGGR